MGTIERDWNFVFHKRKQIWTFSNQLWSAHNGTWKLNESRFVVCVFRIVRWMTRQKSVSPSSKKREISSFDNNCFWSRIQHTTTGKSQVDEAEVDTSAEHEISKPFEKCSETLFNTRLSVCYNNIHERLLFYVCVAREHSHTLNRLSSIKLETEGNSLALAQWYRITLKLHKHPH